MADIETKRTLDKYPSVSAFMDALFEHEKSYVGVFFSIEEACKLYSFCKRWKDSSDDQEDPLKTDFLGLRKLLEKQIADDLENLKCPNFARRFALVFSGDNPCLLFRHDKDSLTVFKEEDPDLLGQQIIKFERSRGQPLADPAREIYSLYHAGSSVITYNHRPENTGAIFQYRSNWPTFHLDRDGTSPDARENFLLILQDIKDITRWYLLGRRPSEIS